MRTTENKKSDNSFIASYSFPVLDGVGNRMQVVQTEPLMPIITPEQTGYTYNDKKNRLLTAGSDNFTHDNEGQLASVNADTHTFDYEHRLKSIQQSAFSGEYFYDGKGNRLIATRGGVTTKYIYDNSGNLLAEADEANIITRYYVHGLGLIAAVTPSDQVYNYHFNAIGSTIAMTDQNQNIVNKYAYDSFGVVHNQVEALSQPFKYVGQYGVMHETNGFYYMRARYYDPKVGRFISEDPIGFEGGTVNLYEYVGNQPMSKIDPLGMLSFNWHYLITMSATLPLGPAFSTLLASDVVWADVGTQGTDAAQANRHAMAGKNQSCKDAIDGTKRFIQDSINNNNYADAIHAAQDLATPLHAGHEWTGTIDSRHLIGDFFPSPRTIWNAYINTLNVLFSRY